MATQKRLTMRKQWKRSEKILVGLPLFLLCFALLAPYLLRTRFVAKQFNLPVLRFSAEELGLQPEDYLLFAISPDASLLAVASERKGSNVTQLKMYDVASKNLVRVIHEGRFSRYPFNIAFSPDGKTLVLDGRSIFFWDVQSGSFLGTLTKNYEREGVSAYNPMFTPNGQHLFVDRDNNLELWQWRNKHLIASFGQTTGVGQSPYSTYGLSKDGKTVATIPYRPKQESPESGDFIRLYDVGSRKLLKTIESKGATNVALSSNAFYVASSQMNVQLEHNARIRVLENRTGKQLWEVKETPETGQFLASPLIFLANDSLIACSIGDEKDIRQRVILRNTRDGHIVAKLNADWGEMFRSVAKTTASASQLSEDGKILIGASYSITKSQSLTHTGDSSEFKEIVFWDVSGF